MKSLKGNIFLITFLVFLLVAPANVLASHFVTNATSLGVRGYGTVSQQEVSREDFVGFRFLIDGEERVFRIKNTPDFSIQNKLQRGASYKLIIQGDMVEDAVILPHPCTTYTPPVRGKPNVKTIKNLLATAIEPVGTVLYVYGGGWNWQDKAEACDLQAPGLRDSWIKFFVAQDASYNFKYLAGTNNKKVDKTQSFYPFGGWVEFHYAGLDCSGYVAWVLDNIMPRADGKQRVTSATKFAKILEDQKLGTVTKNVTEGFKPGSIISLKGHVYICLGLCHDGSVVILHSTPSESICGEKGGGVQFSAINPQNTGKNCDAYRLVERYMKRYFPEWSKRYKADLKDYKDYTNFEKSNETGIFFWSHNSMPDPNGYCEMGAEEILKDLFGE